jgi:hypothetical protein
MLTMLPVTLAASVMPAFTKAGQFIVDRPLTVIQNANGDPKQIIVQTPHFRLHPFIPSIS